MNFLNRLLGKPERANPREMPIEWILATIKLPPDFDRVIVYAQSYPQPKVSTGWYSQGFWHVQGNLCPVSHWMPFPDPPLGAE